LWVKAAIRDEIVKTLSQWQLWVNLSLVRYLCWVGISKGKFFEWKARVGKENDHNAPIPRDFWITEEERQKIIRFFMDNPLNGYRRLAFMMLDQDIVYVCPGTVYNVLKKAGLMGARPHSQSKRGTGFVQPEGPHIHWHIDVSYINLLGTFYYLCSILDGFSRFLVQWELKESMKESEIEIVIEKARHKFPGFLPRIISDNGPQFIAADFKDYIKLCGMTHVRTAPYYPQSNGKIERWHGELKRECIRPKTLTSFQEATTCISAFIDTYNNVRLHSAIAYVTPIDKLEDRAEQILKIRQIKLNQARLTRRKAFEATGLNEKKEVPTQSQKPYTKYCLVRG
jgi:transposase InsO family protein